MMSASRRAWKFFKSRFILVLLHRLAPTVLEAVTIVRPETIVRWHRAGFRSFWRWKSRRRPGRPKVPLEVRQLIRESALTRVTNNGVRTHLNHADGIASIDLFVVPTISFRDQRLRRLNTMPWPELEQERLLQNLVCSLDSWL